MEVHVRNVHEQSTESGLQTFLMPYFNKLSIRCVHCQKPRGKTFASLTFLIAPDAQRFLNLYGQIRSVSNSRPSLMSPKAVNLVFYGKPIYCEKSKKEPNPFTLRMLAREEEERKNHSVIDVSGTDHRKPQLLPISFGCSAISCGVFTYDKSDLVFAPELTWQINGTAKFGPRSVVVTFECGWRIDFRYSSIREIITDEGTIPSFIFSMLEPPVFYEKIGDAVANLLALLNIGAFKPQILPRKNGPQRHRLPYLDEKHQMIAGSCLVYHVALKQDPLIQRLRKAHDLPPMTNRRTKICPLSTSWASQFRELQEKLSSSSISLPWSVKFQIQRLAQSSFLLPHTVLDLVPEIQLMDSRSTTTCVKALRKLFHQIDFPGPHEEAENFQSQALIELLRENESRSKFETLTIYEEARSLTNVAIIHRVKVTPTAIHLTGPEPESNNRVLRKYSGHHDSFIRVQFCDEDGQPVRFNARISNERIFRLRFKKVLEEGINIAGQNYAFLGFSHSSLRAQSCWFMAPFIHEGSLMLVQNIIQQLGNFTVIRSPAKCAARIGQSFSDTRTAITIRSDIVSTVADVGRNGRVFSDGVGTISASVVETICKKLSRKPLSKPTCFQIRYSGAKGMISLDSRLEEDALILRPSMIKFDGSSSTDIEVCETAYRPLQMFLNRQLIKILEDMDVHENFFLNLQAIEVERLRMITESPINASSFLKRQSIGDSVHLPWLIHELASLNLDFRTDWFLRDVLEMALLFELRQLKHKTRIPVEKGWHLHGIMDETGFLEEGQIFCIVNETGRPQVILGKELIISRAPALHPGDVQLAEGVMPPADSPLLKLSNCICFSQKGNRDLPSQLSGGDLDGDRYYIMWDENARPQRTFSPADYPRVEPIDIGRPITVSDMTDFFIEFMETDQLGRIAVLHRVLADQRLDGTLDPDCVKLAEMHSTAVDFSKTGIPVDMSQMPKYSPWRPDFEAPGPHVTIEDNEGIVFDESIYRDPNDDGDDDDDFTKYRYYKSSKVLGKLYRAIDEREIFDAIKAHKIRTSATKESTVIAEVWDYVKVQCLGFQWDHLLEWARGIRDMYEDHLLQTITEYTEHPSRPVSELEAFIGNILGKTGAQSKHQRELSTTMKEKFDRDTLFIVNCIVKDDSEWSEESLERSMACLAVSLEHRAGTKRYGKLVSFKYVAAAVCLREVARLPVY